MEKTKKSKNQILLGCSFRASNLESFFRSSAKRVKIPKPNKTYPILRVPTGVSRLGIRSKGRVIIISPAILSNHSNRASLYIKTIAEIMTQIRSMDSSITLEKKFKSLKLASKFDICLYNNQHTQVQNFETQR